MKRTSFIRILVFSLGLGAVLAAYNNCSNGQYGFGTNTSYCSGSCIASASGSNASIYITTQSATMPKDRSILGGVIFKQQLQISGTCNNAGAAASSITYAVSQGGVSLPNDLYGTPYANHTAVCDNGYYTLVLTPPSDGINNASTVAGTTSSPFQLAVQMNTGTSSTSLSAAAKFVTNFYVQY